MAYRKGELYHYNKNHDPKNGQFTSGPGGSISAVAASRDPKFDDPYYHSYYQDDEVWAKAEGVIYDKVIPKLNGAVRDDDDPELADITAIELADYFYSEYKNYVHDHPEEKGRVDDYVEYVKANATKVDPSFTVRDENNDGYSAISSTPPAPDYEQNYRDRVMRVAANDREFQLMYQRKASDTSLDFWDRYDAQDLADYYKQEADSSERLAKATDNVYAFKPSADEKRLENERGTV